jgi:hypothetical protein
VTYTNLVNVKRMAQPLPGTGAPSPSSRTDRPSRG